jgi:hypothetical protein
MLMQPLTPTDERSMPFHFNLKAMGSRYPRSGAVPAISSEGGRYCRESDLIIDYGRTVETAREDGIREPPGRPPITL